MRVKKLAQNSTLSLRLGPALSDLEALTRNSVESGLVRSDVVAGRVYQSLLAGVQRKRIPGGRGGVFAAYRSPAGTPPRAAVPRPDFPPVGSEGRPI
jgi:hypothetical protein